MEDPALRILNHLFENNRTWAAQMTERDPEFFSRLWDQQRPEYLWIGCSDSRVPANEIVGLAPGELFVHRNIANVVIQYDLNSLSVLQYAVEVLRVKHVIVCGHYGCGGVLAALRGDRLGLIDDWLRHVRSVYDKSRGMLDTLATDEQRHARLCELNVIEQVANVCHTPVLRDAWHAGQTVSVHGWIYGMQDGILRDLGICVTGTDELDRYYDAARAGRTPQATHNSV